MSRTQRILLASVVLVAVACGSESGSDFGPVSTAASEADSTATPANPQYVENFEFVWATINEEYFDPEFGGLDWADAHARYLPLIWEADNDEVFYEVLNAMVFELGVSHLGVLPPGQHQQIDPVLTAEGELGIDVRLLDGECVITAVVPGSSAAEAGLQPGYILDSVSGQSIAQITASAPPLPPNHERGRRSAEINAVRSHLYGEPGTITTISFRDADDTAQTLTLTLGDRGSASEIMPGLPPAITELEVDRLESGIGYISFNAFVPDLEPLISDAIDEMSDAPGLIFDLRGNHGGVFEVRKALVDKLVDEPMLLWRYAGRDSTVEISTEPSQPTYQGQVVVIVDVLSASSAEEFAGGLQAIDRASIVGERTAGRVLTAEFAAMPNGGLLVYPAGQTIVADGTVLEAHGVLPDLPVATTRFDLLAGVDAPIERAIDHIQSQD